jgi:hypothetical protein
MRALGRWGPGGPSLGGVGTVRGEEEEIGANATTYSPEMYRTGFDGIPQSSLSVVDMELGGLISPRMRHIIKRYVKRVGLRDIKVEHLCDGGPATVRLVVTGVASGRLSDDQTSKLEYLETAITKSLARQVNGIVPHPSQADPEILRLALSEVEPSMKRVFYSRA